MKTFSGKTLFLDRNDINTDEIIPAKYLTEISKEALRPHLLEDLTLKGFEADRDIPGKSVIVTRENFGCGSSREHAPWALEVNGIHLVIAQSFARIFRQNMFNCGMMAVELSGRMIDHIFDTYANRDTVIETDLKDSLFTISTDSTVDKLDFSISDFDRDLVEAGGWLEFADTNY